VVGSDRAGARLWTDERAVRERDHMLAGRSTVPYEMLGDQDAVALSDAEDSLVEQLVVQRAQTQAVVDVVRAVERSPAHMRGLQPDRHGPDPPVIAAEGAAVLVGSQHQLPHPPIRT
jgi:hypothetical protein